MIQRPFRFWLYLAIDSCVLVLCLLHAPSLLSRATLPFEIDETRGRVIVGHIADSLAAGPLKTGDVILRWGDAAVSTPEEAEFLGDFGSIGERVTLLCQRAGEIRAAEVFLVPYYPKFRYVIITFFTGISIWGVGIYVLWKGWHDLVGRVLHWMLICFSAVVMLTWGAVLPNLYETFIRQALFLTVYETGIPLFFFFTVLYPKRKPGPMALIALFIFVPAAAMLASSSYFYLKAVHFRSLLLFDSFQDVYDIFHVAIFFYIIGGILNIVHSYVKAGSPEERERLKWLLWGFTVGALPYLFLYVLPQLLFSRYIINEEYVTIFYLVIPFSFAVSFLKYRLFDIGVVINRSIVYTVLTMFIGATYVLAVFLLTSIIGGQAAFEEYVYIGGVTLVVAWVMNPLRKRIQRLVDEILFAARTNFRSALIRISEALHAALNTADLFTAIAESIQNIIPAEVVAVYSSRGDSLVLEASRGTGTAGRLNASVAFPAAFAGSKAIALREAVRLPDPSISFDQQPWLHEIGLSVCVPIKTESGNVLGFVGVRPRSAREKYDENEVDLMVTLCAHSAEVLERLQLQERVILEREETKRLEELNNLKSEFVSSVSHEFRTPLTSVKIFAELLRRRVRRGDAKAKEYLDVIDGESERLNRMVMNVLDAARIEKGVKEFIFEEVDLCATARGVIETMKYEMRKNQCSVDVKIPKRKVIIHGDRDAVARAIMNLLSNAIKYSSGKKFVRIEVSSRPSFALCRVTDRGDGISEEAMSQLFKKFYREPSHKGAVQGIGLGLSLVKHIMEAHDGSVDVKSTPGQGSSFTLMFPTTEKQWR